MNYVCCFVFKKGVVGIHKYLPDRRQASLKEMPLKVIIVLAVKIWQINAKLPSAQVNLIWRHLCLWQKPKLKCLYIS